jgi:hypothetical protein
MAQPRDGRQLADLEATPRPITAQNAPAKIEVKPLIEKAAEQVASASAARSVTVAMLRSGVTVCAGLRVTVRVTLRFFFLLR